MRVGACLEREAWRTGQRYIDRSGCVWRRTGEMWKPDGCAYSTPPVPKAEAAK